MLIASSRAPTISDRQSRNLFLIAALLVLSVSGALAMGFPIQCSMVAVFALAGPHNWIEARYFLTRHPARWGKLWQFFLLSFGGIAVLTFGFALIPWLGADFRWTHDEWLSALTIWNLSLIAWVYVLVALRARQPPRRDWALAAPVALAAAGTAIIFPGQMSVLWIYVHPLMGLWILDREILRSRRDWSSSYRVCVGMIPLWLIVIASRTNGEEIAETGQIAEQIVAQAGSAWVPWLSSRLMVSAHAFLELIHYGVWLVAIPIVNGRVLKPLAMTVPLAKRSPRHRRAIFLLLVTGIGIIITLWIGFRVDYVTTRDLYFTIAMAHVLAEVPFLLRSL